MKTNSITLIVFVVLTAINATVFGQVPKANQSMNRTILDGLIFAWQGKLNRMDAITTDSVNIVTDAKEVQHTLTAYRKMFDSARRDILRADSSIARQIVDLFHSPGLSGNQRLDRFADFTKCQESVVAEFTEARRDLVVKRANQVSAAESAMNLAEEEWRRQPSIRNDSNAKRMSWLLHCVDLELTRLQLRDMEDEAAIDRTQSNDSRYAYQECRKALEFFEELRVEMCDPNAVAQTD